MEDNRVTAEARERVAELFDSGRIGRDIEKVFDEIDRRFDWQLSQRQMLMGREEWLQAQMRAGRWWKLVEGVEKVLNAAANAAMQRRHEAIDRQRREYRPTATDRRDGGA